ncbi:MAG: hypothetical protein AAF560_25875 [Acidobacteriota bacterium]
MFQLFFARLWMFLSGDGALLGPTSDPNGEPQELGPWPDPHG